MIAGQVTELAGSRCTGRFTGDDDPEAEFVEEWEAALEFLIDNAAV